MKGIVLKKLSDQIKKLMVANHLSAKDLAKKSKITYSSLMPILNGARECGISKLISIAEALNCSPDTLLKGAFSIKNPDLIQDHRLLPPRYFAVFISIIKVTYCRFYEVKSNTARDFVLPFALRCGDEVDVFFQMKDWFTLKNSKTLFCLNTE